MERILKQIRNLDIPYPQKNLLELEVHRDIQHLGVTDADGIFSNQDLKDLEEIHSTKIHRVLTNLKAGHRKSIEMASVFFPLSTAIIFTIKEGNMFDFIREGGAGMYAILAIGIFLLGKEALGIIRLLIVKDHSPANLRIDTSSVWLGCLALMLIGVAWTSLGLYISATAVARDHASYNLLLIGAKESLTPIILSSVLATLTALAHYATRQMLLKWQAPILDEA